MGRRTKSRIEVERERCESEIARLFKKRLHEDGQVTVSFTQFQANVQVKQHGTTFHITVPQNWWRMCHTSNFYALIRNAIVLRVRERDRQQSSYKLWLVDYIVMDYSDENYGCEIRQAYIAEVCEHLGFGLRRASDAVNDARENYSRSVVGEEPPPFGRINYDARVKP
jgi:hypothetical protein